MPAPKRFPDRDEIAVARAEADALDADAEAPTTRRLAGRVLARRDMGKLMFLDLVDPAEKSRRFAPQLFFGAPMKTRFSCGTGRSPAPRPPFSRAMITSADVPS